MSGVHSIMMEKSALAGEGGGYTPTPFHYSYHHITYQVDFHQSIILLRTFSKSVPAIQPHGVQKNSVKKTENLKTMFLSCFLRPEFKQYVVLQKISWTVLKPEIWSNAAYKSR